MRLVSVWRLPAVATLASAIALIARPTRSSADVQVRPRCDTIAVPASAMVTLVAVGERGSVAWTEGRRAAVFSVRSPDGEIRSIGRNGAGPGEFRGIVALGWRGDTLWVFDGALRRVSGFRDGVTFLRTISTPQALSVLARDDTSFVGAIVTAATPAQGSLAAFPLSIGSIVPARGSAEPFLSLEAVPPSAPVLPLLRAARIIRTDRKSTVWCATMPGRGNMTQLGCVASSGEVLLRKDFELAARPVSQQLWNDLIGELANQTGSSAQDAAAPFARPSSVASAFDLLVNDHSAVWLLRTTPVERTAVWDRIALTGRMLSPVELPSRLHLLAIDGNVAYAADTDTDGAQALVRCAF